MRRQACGMRRACMRQQAGADAVHALQNVADGYATCAAQHRAPSAKSRPPAARRPKLGWCRMRRGRAARWVPSKRRALQGGWDALGWQLLGKASFNPAPAAKCFLRLCLFACANSRRDRRRSARRGARRAPERPAQVARRAPPYPTAASTMTSGLIVTAARQRGGEPSLRHGARAASGVEAASPPKRAHRAAAAWPCPAGSHSLRDVLPSFPCHRKRPARCRVLVRRSCAKCWTRSSSIPKPLSDHPDCLGSPLGPSESRCAGLSGPREGAERSRPADGSVRDAFAPQYLEILPKTQRNYACRLTGGPTSFSLGPQAVLPPAPATIRY
jgi:hypothetical protein